MDLIFWQNMPAHHQSGAIKHCARDWPGEVLGVYDIEMLPERKKLGWQIPDMGRVRLHFAEGQKDVGAFVAGIIQRHPGAIHLLNGVRGARVVEAAWALLRKDHTARLGLTNERPYMNTRYAVLKRLWYKRFVAKYGSRFQVVLAMGSSGVDFYRSIGYSDDVVFPYMYQSDLEAFPALPTERSQRAEAVRMVYVGRFARDKGTDLLLEALKRLPVSANWRIDFAGDADGTFGREVREISNTHPNIRYVGNWKSDEVIKNLLEYDVCLVPSRWDGWGMLGTEACIAGLGVIATDAVGSSDLVRASGAGEVIPVDNADALHSILDRIIKDPNLVVAWKAKAREYRERLQAIRVGEYLREVIEYRFISGLGPRPRAHWL